MQKLLFIVLLALLFSFASCDNESNSLVGPTPSGAYSYTSFDSLGMAIVRGWFTMIHEDSTKLIGNWSFQNIGNPQDVGPQVGAGKLVGSQIQDITSIALNPDIRDNNINLRGTIMGNKFSGEWIWFTIAGIANHGTFEAIKN